MSFDVPQSRNEAILQNILGASNPLGAPQSRIETLLHQLLEKSSGDPETERIIAELQAAVGDLGELGTAEKSNLVAAINEAMQSGGSVSPLKPCKAFTGKLPTFNISNQGWSSWSTSDYNTTEANIASNKINVRASVVPFIAGQNPGGKLASLLAPPTNTTYNRTVSLSLEKALNGFAYSIRPNLNYNGSIYYTTETGGWRVYQGTPDSAVYSTGSMAYFSLLIQTTVPVTRGQQLFDFEKDEAFQYSCPLQVGDPISTLNDYSYAPNAYILHNDTTSANVLGSTFGDLLRKIVPMTMSAHYAFTHTANADTCLIMIAARLTLCTDIPVTTTAEGYRSIAIGDLPAIIVPTNLFGNMLID